MPNILTFDAAGRGTGWQKSKSQDKYYQWPHVRECADRPSNPRHTRLDGEGWRAATAEEIADRNPPREQGDTEAAFQALCESLGFNHKPTTEECKAVLQTIEQTDPMTAIKVGLELLAMRSGLLQSVGAWEEWIWKIVDVGT